MRELFSLTTLAAVTIALVSYHGWDNHERWLLGLTLGTTLTAILVTRVFGKRAWLAGVLLGTLAGWAVIGISVWDWIIEYRQFASPNVVVAFAASSIAQDTRIRILAVATSAVIAALLAVGISGCFHGIVWAMSRGPQSLFTTVRRHPKSAAAVLLTLVLFALAVANFEFLLAPRSWPARHRLSLEPVEHGSVMQDLFSVPSGSLSRHGEWLLVERYVPGSRERAVKQLYRLGRHPQVASFTEQPDRASFVAFDCDRNRIAFVEWLGESYADRPSETHQIRIVDLDRHTSEVLAERPSEFNIESLQWLPGGSLVILYADYGYTRLDWRDERWHRQDSGQRVHFNAHATSWLEIDDDQVRIVDASTSVPKANLPNLANPSDLRISPNGRFILTSNRIYDLERDSYWEWEFEPWASIHLHSFTPRNLVVTYHHKAYPRAGRTPKFLYDVPLVKHIVYWLQREPLRLIDPATGQEVARTRPLDIWPYSVEFSHDGSRMAVFSYECVDIYDVPAAHVSP